MADYGLLIDYKYCTGCNTCVVACRKEKGIPLEEWGITVNKMGPQKLGGEWEFDYVPVPSRLCDLCIDRIEEGKKPACAHHCLALCMEAVPVDQISTRMAELGKKVVCYIP